ncbi:hypothetical protein [Paenibacillus sp. N3.4]|uniref:hypothetical protein n=1 Tax=Paenibacillus sp. N3.4 TaxID=2603222 RepID=UPI0011CBA77A|nr:hypothetical protein [Paenibacillus sp. N3.4]TXK86007.1 hypothetical protein FU659_00710 [Paenibacillus sp. N3.4]
MDTWSSWIAAKRHPHYLLYGMGANHERLTSVWPGGQATLNPQPTPTPSELLSSSIEQRLNDIREWKTADHRFTTDAKEPLILLQNDKQIVYMQNNQIRYEWIGGSGFQNNPLRFPSTRTGYIWRNDKTAYIGFPLTNGERKQGEWYEINLTTTVSNPLKRVGDMQIAPEGIQSITFSNKPAGALFLEKTVDHYQEYWMNGQGRGQLFVNDYSASQDRTNMKPPVVSEADRTVLTKVKEFDNLTIMEDERGLLIYQNGSVSPSIYRLSGYKLGRTQPINIDTALRSQPPYTGPNALLLSINSMENGTEKGLLLPSTHPTPFILSVRLMEEGWTLLSGLNLVRMKNDILQTISYPSTQGMKSLEPHEVDLSMKGVTAITRDGSMMQGTKDGIKQYLSLYDLMNTRGSMPEESLWMSTLAAGRISKSEKSEGPTKEVMLLFPKREALEKEQSLNAAIPEQLQNALKQRDYSGSGDASNNRTVRQVGEEWYVLTGDRMERWEASGGLKDMGKLPVKQHCSISNYMVCQSAADFISKDGYWYVADTFGNRILKLSKKWEITEESPIPMPWKVGTNEKGEIEGYGLQGITLFTNELEKLSTTAALPQSVSKLPKEEVAVYPESLYEDPIGVQWLYESSRLYVYDPLKMNLLTHHVGSMTNAVGKPKILLYMNKMLLVFDDHIHVFDTKGNWQKEITFPRTKPDGIYDATPKGENSYVLDREKGLLYMIQGFRLLRIDLTSGAVTPLLWQLNTNMGNLLMDREKLYVTLHTGLGNEQSDSNEELIMIDAKSGGLVRWKIGAGFTTDHIGKDHELILSKPSDSTTGSIASGSYMSYKLNEQGRPE